jgi:hypothetical protein
MAKLTEANVLVIRSLLGRRSHAEISGFFGVSRSCIYSIAVGRTWAWLED